MNAAKRLREAEAKDAIVRQAADCQREEMDRAAALAKSLAARSIHR